MPHKTRERRIQRFELGLGQAENRLDTADGNGSIQNQRVIAQRPTRRNLAKKFFLILCDESCSKKARIEIFYRDLKFLRPILIQNLHVIRPDLLDRAPHSIHAIVIRRDDKRAEFTMCHTPILTSRGFGEGLA